MLRARRIVCLCLLSAAAVALMGGSGAADLAGRYQSGQQQASQLRARIGAQEQRIQGFEGSIASLQARLGAVQRSVAEQEQLLGTVADQHTAARTRLVTLRATYTRDLQTLAAQLRAQYEALPPTLVNVVVDAGGFNALINGIRDLIAVQRSNVRSTRAVAAARVAVQAQTSSLAKVLARRRRATAAVLAERDDIARGTGAGGASGLAWQGAAAALIGISGYRTPQHSVEVGGFADDPHTRGEASDTPGVEGVPEATLNQFCLTRPFPGAREADHIQELGSPT